MHVHWGKGSSGYLLVNRRLQYLCWVSSATLFGRLGIGKAAQPCGLVMVLATGLVKVWLQRMWRACRAQ